MVVVLPSGNECVFTCDAGSIDSCQENLPDQHHVPVEPRYCHDCMHHSGSDTKISG